MHIYIDESGIFTANKDKPHAISCIAALIVPEILESIVFEAFNQWKLLPALQKYKDGSGEIKGSKLNESEIASLLLLLKKFDVVVEVICIDLGNTTDAEIDQFKRDIADGFSKSETGQKTNVKFKKDVIISLSKSNQLFLQALTLYNLMKEVLSISIPYYAQRFSQELEKFRWVIDTKIDTNGNRITEEIMTDLVKPFLQSFFFKNSTPILEGEDYSALNKFFIPHHDLLEPLKNRATEQSIILDIGKITEDMSFSKSDSNAGLQIVDIIVNCIRRAMRGNLQFDGWKYLSNLLIFRKKGSITVIRIDPETSINLSPSYTEFVNYFKRCGKEMLVPTNVKQIINKSKKGYIKWNYLDKESNSKWKITTLEYY